MADIELTQTEADALIAMSKVKLNDDAWEYPGLGGEISVPLTSSDKREQFILDVSRGRIDMLKGTYQNRARQVVVLVRLDFGGSPHRNPDGEEVGCPHLHIYREGFGDKWAAPIPIDRFPNITDLWQTLHDFMKYCNIIEPPHIQRGLFT
ncbi:MAG: hypothetical protein ONB46_18745 [candidate division KSB1 bacterium]|nr:hypothetical protein [candidate division KSB1 bacterium]MDZ7367920.1 hypothetical protein [candidate division KSB1 bacterium]MDZ7406513.1 hypothetical protein [candidate division KSB1 bacterium]